MQITETILKGCFILQSRIFEDQRGIFYESYHKKTFEQAIGKPVDFVQDNVSVSKKGVLRGFHFQTGAFAQSKMIRVVDGKILDVVVDLREESETFGAHLKLELSASTNKAIFIPKGMAHGFLTISDKAVFSYKCDAYYNSASESGIIYNDKTLNVDWEYPMNEIILSEKDEQLPTFKELYQ